MINLLLPSRVIPLCAAFQDALFRWHEDDGDNVEDVAPGVLACRSRKILQLVAEGPPAKDGELLTTLVACAAAAAAAARYLTFPFSPPSECLVWSRSLQDGDPGFFSRYAEVLSLAR